MSVASGNAAIRRESPPVMVAATASVMPAAVQWTTAPACAPVTWAMASLARSPSSSITKNSGSACATAVATPSELRDTPSGVNVPLALITTLKR